MDADPLAAALHLAADFGDQFQHVAHVDDVGHIFEHHLLIGQDAGRDHRQYRVLVARCSHGAAQRNTAFNFESRHLFSWG